MADYDNPRPTSQPIGSTDLVVAKDNLITLDRMVSGPSGTQVSNRKGEQLTTLVDILDGANSKVNDAIGESFGVFIGNYPQTYTNYNQYTVFNGQQYGIKTPSQGGPALPYTPTEADPANDANLKIYGDASQSFVRETVTVGQEELIGGQIYPEIGDLENGMTVPSGSTHLRVAGRIYAMSPVATGSVTAVTSTSATVGGVDVILKQTAVTLYASVSDMLNGYPRSASVGDICRTGATIWIRNSDATDLISDFTPVTQVFASDFGANQSDIESAYSATDEIVISQDYSVTDFTLSKRTVFINDAKLTVFGTLTVNAEIIAPNRLVLDVDAVTEFVVAPSAISEIKPLWFSNAKYGQSQTVYGYRAGVNLLGKKAENGTDYNAVCGYRAAENTTKAIESAVFGTFAAAGATEINLSTALGYGALRGKESSVGSGVFNPTIAQNATAVGQAALQDGTAHTNSVAVGGGAGKGVGVSVSATLIGANCARIGGDLSNVVFLGSGTGYNWGSTGSAADSQYTTLVGSDIGFNCTQGVRSTLVGSRSALYSTICNDNTWVGYLTGPDSGTYSTVSKSICIGSVARAREGNTITIGNSVTNSVQGRILLGHPTDNTSAIMHGIYNSTSASAANVFIDSSGRLLRSTSSMKYKEVIEGVTLDWAKKTLDFEPILYKPTENVTNEDWSYYGFSAEQVADIDPRYVHMERTVLGSDEHGNSVLGGFEPAGVMYERLVVAQQVIIKNLIDRVERLEIERLTVN